MELCNTVAANSQDSRKRENHLQYGLKPDSLQGDSMGSLKGNSGSILILVFLFGLLGTIVFLAAREPLNLMNSSHFAPSAAAAKAFGRSVLQAQSARCSQASVIASNRAAQLREHAVVFCSMIL